MEEIIDSFFEEFTEDDYYYLKTEHERYLSKGGHLPDFVASAASVFEESLATVYVATCVASDRLASKEFWINDPVWFDELQISLHQNTAREWECRERLRDNLAIANGVDVSFELLGIVMPEVEILEAIADLADAGGAMVEYYAGINYGIMLLYMRTLIDFDFPGKKPVAAVLKLDVFAILLVAFRCQSSPWILWLLVGIFDLCGLYILTNVALRGGVREYLGAILILLVLVVGVTAFAVSVFG